MSRKLTWPTRAVEPPSVVRVGSELRRLEGAELKPVAAACDFGGPSTRGIQTDAVEPVAAAQRQRGGTSVRDRAAGVAEFGGNNVV
jgi:hypothetical protein